MKRNKTKTTEKNRNMRKKEKRNKFTIYTHKLVFIFCYLSARKNKLMSMKFKKKSEICKTRALLNSLLNFKKKVSPCKKIPCLFIQ